MYLYGFLFRCGRGLLAVPPPRSCAFFMEQMLPRRKVSHLGIGMKQCEANESNQYGEYHMWQGSSARGCRYPYRTLTKMYFVS